MRSLRVLSLFFAVLVVCTTPACSLFSEDGGESKLPPPEPGNFVVEAHNEKGFEDYFTGYSGWKTFDTRTGPQTYIILSQREDAAFWENSINIVYSGKPKKGISRTCCEGQHSELDVIYYRQRDRLYSGIFSIDSGELTITGNSEGYLTGQIRVTLEKGGWALDNLTFSVNGRFQAVRDTLLASDLVEQ